MNIYYTANNGNKKVIEDVTQRGAYRYDANGKSYLINRDGLYDLLQVCCMGPCNTYWRTIGRYPHFNG
jgi:hypothetical protein